MKQYIGLTEMSNGNCASVLNVIRNCGALSRKQISDITGLSWGGMTKIVNRLTEHAYIIEEKGENTSSTGRTPGLLRVNDKQYYVIGLDINRAGFGAYVMNLCGDVLKEYEREVLISDRNRLLDDILNFTKEIVEDYKERQLLSIGIAMQGIVDAKNGISKSFPRCQGWEDVPLRALMQENFGVNVFVEHDPNCMLYHFLNEEDGENMLLFRVDHSIGMAASLEGEILQGSGILEIAHCLVVPNGKDCGCQRQGCLESYISPCLENGKLQKEALPEMVSSLAMTMYNMAKIFNAEKIIVTGRLVKYREQFEEALGKKFYELMQDERIELAIVQESKQAVQGVALIAVQGAIDGLRL